MQSVAVMIASPIKPSLLVLALDVNHQRIAFPSSVRPSHPAIGWGICRGTHVDGSNGAPKFVSEKNCLGVLDDLKGIRQIGGARNASHIALVFRVQLQAIGKVLLLFL